MPFILLFFAVVLIIGGIRGTLPQLGSLLLADFTGPKNFGVWLLAFFVIGAVGYIPGFKKLSDAFLLLVIVVILIVNDQNGNGFFTGIENAINGNVSATTGAQGIVSPSAGVLTPIQ